MKNLSVRENGKKLVKNLVSPAKKCKNQRETQQEDAIYESLEEK